MGTKRISFRQRRARRRARQARAYDPAWLTSGVLVGAGLIWWTLLMHGVVTQHCRAFVDFWLDRELQGMALLQWTSLLSLALAAWFLAECLRPKAERVSVMLRILQGLVPAFMVLISTLQWGLVQPDGPIAPTARRIATMLESTPITRALWIPVQVEFDDLWLPDYLQALQADYEADWEALLARYPPYPGGGFLDVSPFQSMDGALYCEAEARLTRYWDQRFEIEVRIQAERLQAED